MKCEHIVGLIYDYENTHLTTLDGLKQHIKDELELKRTFETDPLYKGYNHGIKGWTLADYADRRKSTDMCRFDFCPLCGEKIDWKALRNQ